MTTTQHTTPALDRNIDQRLPRLPWHKRVWKSQALMHYNRLAVLLIAANAAAFAALFSQAPAAQSPALSSVNNLIVINLLVGVLFRQQYVVNALFWLATRAPLSWPLRVRWTLGKIYHFGGIHVGAMLSATSWFLVFAVLLLTTNGPVSVPLAAVTVAVIAALFVQIAFALPAVRARHHNLFEAVHRFNGWTILVLLWGQSIIFVAQKESELSVLSTLVTSWSFWALVVATVSVIIPWTRLRRVPVHIDRPSNHVAIARFDYGTTPFAGSSTTLSLNPLREWHSFANVPSPGQSGFRLTISRAGDWTGSFVDSLPEHVWVKGIPTAGVGNIDQLFRKVIWVATGSGIGPCLPHLLSGLVPAQLVWSTRAPRETYGNELVDEILAAQPSATIWDTTRDGKPDLLELVHQAYLDSDAEAIICIANKKTTWSIVTGMEERGVPAFGAIWDS